MEDRLRASSSSSSRLRAVAAHLEAKAVLSAPIWSDTLFPGKVTTLQGTGTQAGGGGDTLVVEWAGYHTMACSWGHTRDAVEHHLFLGFTDGAANIMLCDKPLAAPKHRQQWYQLVDPTTRRRSPLFVERTPPFPTLALLRDLGGGWISQLRGEGTGAGGEVASASSTSAWQG